MKLAYCSAGAGKKAVTWTGFDRSLWKVVCVGVIGGMKTSVKVLVRVSILMKSEFNSSLIKHLL